MTEEKRQRRSLAISAIKKDGSFLDTLPKSPCLKLTKFLTCAICYFLDTLPSLAKKISENWNWKRKTEAGTRRRNRKRKRKRKENPKKKGGSPKLFNKR